jgi:hypothetical protein
MALQNPAAGAGVRGMVAVSEDVRIVLIQAPALLRPTLW